MAKVGPTNNEVHREFNHRVLYTMVTFMTEMVRFCISICMFVGCGRKPVFLVETPANTNSFFYMITNNVKNNKKGTDTIVDINPLNSSCKLKTLEFIVY